MTRIGGRNARAEGEAFECRVEYQALFFGFAVVHMPPGGRHVRSGSGVKIIPQKNPFDFVISKRAPTCTVSIYFDAKTTAGNTFAFSAINQIQISELLPLERVGNRAGYLICFRASGLVAFLSASKLASLRPGEGLRPEDGLALGTSMQMDLLPLLS